MSARSAVDADCAANLRLVYRAAMSQGKVGADTEQVDSSRSDGTRADASAERTSLLLYHAEGATMVPLIEGEAIIVGRDPESDVALEDRGLSRAHAKFTLQGDAVEVEDLRSTNGTWVAGKRIERATLGPSAEATLGGVIASVHRLESADGGPRAWERHDVFKEALRTELVRAAHFRRQTALLMVRPLDDEMVPLRRWSSAFPATLRAFDRMALYSGDTLEVLLVEAGAESAAQTATALCQVARCTLGVGIAVFPDHGTSVEELVEAAREARRACTTSDPVVLSRRGTTTTVSSPATEDGPIIASAAMSSVFATATKLARSVIPVLLIAETGAGKEVIAQHLHEAGPRRGRPMVSVNCAAIAAQLIESTLFGHERGAFTGATQQHAGVFEAASGGTVFLDEVGELPAAAQAALLRVLETKRVTRVGGTKEIEVDVRIVAATHRNLDAMVAAGRFRQDLLYRLNAMTLAIPPLRKRRADIRPLCRRFLSEAANANGVDVTSIEEGALEALERHTWPGNVRELRNVVERAVVIASGSEIRVDDLPLDLKSSVEPTILSQVDAATDEDVVEDFRSTMERLEAEVLLAALRAVHGNQTKAAKRLSMPLRTLVHKIKVHNLKKHYDKG